MPQRSLDQLGTLQRAIMEAVWRLEEATVQDVLDALGRKKKPAYTTILSAMQKLERLGWLRHRREGRTYVYRARASHQQAGQKALRKLVDQVFRGDPLLLFQHLLDDQALGSEDLAKLEEMIDRRRKESSNG